MTGEGYSWRYGARDPWLAPWPRAALYLIWRALVASVRPALFLALAAASLALVFAAVTAPGPVHVSTAARHDPFSGRDVSTGTGIELIIRAAIPASVTPRALWEARIAQALDAGPWRTPDLALAESLARSLPVIEGEDALAFSILAEDRSAAHVNADLRARPVWVRQHRLRAALEARLAAGVGLDPPFLVFANPYLTARFDRARSLYGPARDAAEAWFASPRGAAIHLPSLAGWRGGLPITLFGDARDLAHHGCALAAASGRRMSACAGAPEGSQDPVLTGLLLAAAAMPGEGGAGGRLIAAAYASGHLDAGLAQQLALGPDPDLGRESLLAALTPLLLEAGMAAREPWRFDGQVQAAAREHARAARLDPAIYQEVAGALNAVRRSDGALAALRIAAWLNAPQDAPALARLAAAHPGQLLAFDALAGAQVLDAARPAAPVRSPPQTPRRAILLALASLPAALALAMVAAALSGASRSRRRGRPGPLARMDAAVSVLILGRNS